MFENLQFISVVGVNKCDNSSLLFINLNIVLVVLGVILLSHCYVSLKSFACMFTNVNFIILFGLCSPCFILCFGRLHVSYCSNLIQLGFPMNWK